MSFGRETFKSSAQQAIYDLARAGVIYIGVSWIYSPIKQWASQQLKMTPQQAIAWGAVVAVITAFVVILCLDLVIPLFRRSRVVHQDEWKNFTKWAPVYGKKFRNCEVEIDGRFFDRCEFTNVTLVFNGHGPVKIENPIWHGTLMFKSTNQIAITAAYMMQLVMQLQKHLGGELIIATGDEHGNLKPIDVQPRKVSDIKKQP